MDEKNYMEEHFLKEFATIGEEINQIYAPIIENYVKYVVPFENRRMTQNQSLIFENSTLEKTKIELLGKIEELKAELDKHENVIEQQQSKIYEYERKIENLENREIVSFTTIDQLKRQIENLDVSLSMKVENIKQISEDLKELKQSYDTKNNEYNNLLANYMKDKTNIAEKLNSINEMENEILEKNKKIKEEQFYLTKKWEKLEEKEEEIKNNKSSSKTEITAHKKEEKPRREIFVEKELENEMKEKTNEILRDPTKHIYKHHQSEIYACSLNFNGNLLATCGGDSQIRIYDISSHRNVTSIMSNSAESIYISLQLNSGGERLLAGSTDKKVTIYHSESGNIYVILGKPMHTFLGHGGKINAVGWTSMKEKCVSGAEDKQVKVWDIEKASNILSISCGSGVRALKSSSNEPVVYTGHSDGSVRVYSVNQGNTPICKIQGALDFPITSLCRLGDKYQVAVSTTEGESIYLLDLKMNKKIGKLDYSSYYNSCSHVDVTPSDNYILAGNADGSIYYWNHFNCKFVRKVTGHEAAVGALEYHQTSGTLVSTDKVGNIIIWQ